MTGQHWSNGYLGTPVLLAENIRKAAAHVACTACRRLIDPGERLADRADGGGVVHVGCAQRLPDSATVVGR